MFRSHRHLGEARRTAVGAGAVLGVMALMAQGGTVAIASESDDRERDEAMRLVAEAVASGDLTSASDAERCEELWDSPTPCDILEAQAGASMSFPDDVATTVELEAMHSTGDDVRMLGGCESVTFTDGQWQWWRNLDHENDASSGSTNLEITSHDPQPALSMRQTSRNMWLPGAGAVESFRSDLVQGQAFRILLSGSGVTSFPARVELAWDTGGEVTATTGTLSDAAAPFVPRLITVPGANAVSNVTLGARPIAGELNESSPEIRSEIDSPSDSRGASANVHGASNPINPMPSIERDSFAPARNVTTWDSVEIKDAAVYGFGINVGSQTFAETDFNRAATATASMDSPDDGRWVSTPTLQVTSLDPDVLFAC